MPDRTQVVSDEYAAALVHYAWARKEMNRQRKAISQEAYERMYTVVEAARFQWNGCGY